MQHIIHNEQYDTAVLIKTASLQKTKIEDAYIKPTGLKAISFSLDYAGKKKPSATTIKEYLETLLPSLDKLGIKDLLVCDGEYFKKLCKVQKADPHYGYVLPVAIKGYEHMNAVLCPNHSAIMFNPAMQDKIDLALATMVQHKEGTYTAIGEDIIHFEEYPDEYEQIKTWLSALHQYPCLSADIEAYSLKHHDAGIGTISFAWSQHEGIAFSVDTTSCDPTEIQVWDKKDKKYKKRIAVNECVTNEPVRALLKEFFETYQGRLIWHGSAYDCYVLIYQLWMDHLLDQEGLLRGLDVMHGSMEDSLFVTYLATNSCAGNHLGLKDQAHEFAGNYAESDINDIRLIPEPQLLKYNLVDALATWYVMDKHYDTMVLDEQLPVYELFKKFQKDILQMQLTGACLDMAQVHKAEKELQTIFNTHYNALLAHPIIKDFEKRLRQSKWQKDFDDRKAKAVNPDKIQPKELSAFDEERFNPNSGVQLQQLLYEDMGLPVIDKTKTGAPATGGKTLKKIIKTIQDEEALYILNNLRDYAGVAKVLTAFIPVFKEAPQAPDGMHYLFGTFKLCGTVSGRLSSKQPNLQQIPSGSTYAKVIKKCFVAPKGYLFIGADSASLEDRIDTVLTQDPNKRKVYTQGYDGHCLRAFFYFNDQITGLTDSVEDVNSMKDLYPDLRQDSKAPTFALTYDGTYRTLMTNLGWSEEKSLSVVNNYDMMYQVSRQWKRDRLAECVKQGFATVAFGLRVRTPLLKKSLLGTRVTTSQAAAESRTVGNAMGQSYGLLNSRSGNEFMELVRNDPEKRLLIKPSMQIHDAQYYYVKDDIDLMKWVNDEIPRCMSWQELEPIKDPEIPLPAEVDIQYPTWKDVMTIPNGASKQEIIDICIQEAKERNEKEAAT